MPTMLGKSRQQEFEIPGHAVSIIKTQSIKTQRAENERGYRVLVLHLNNLGAQPGNDVTHNRRVPTSVNKIKMYPHRHARKPIFQEILNSAK